MDKAELLRTFTDRVDQFEKYQSFIAKAKEQSGKFAAAVVGKVIKDNEARCLEIVGEIMPLIAEMEQVIERLQRERDEALESAKESQFRLEELELRLAIGDLTEDDFTVEAADYKAVVDSADSKVAELDGEREHFQTALARWNKVGGSSGVLQGASAAAPTEQRTASPERANRRPPTPPPPLEPEEVEIGDEEDGEPEPMVEAPEEAEADVVFEANAGGDGFEVDDLDLLGEDEDIQLDEGAGEKEDKPRRAVLLYQEGTAEEQIYPFTGEVMSLGRGRDNDVQVKNDSKVSRYHCKLYRRGPNFYIEDNKSANGTLVNGELITERRLFGGEEVIIGETFFRFRILD